MYLRLRPACKRDTAHGVAGRAGGMRELPNLRSARLMPGRRSWPSREGEAMAVILRFPLVPRSDLTPGRRARAFSACDPAHGGARRTGGMRELPELLFSPHCSVSFG